MFAAHEAMIGANPGRWGPLVVMLVAGGACHPEDAKKWEGVRYKGKTFFVCALDLGFLF